MGEQGTIIILNGTSSAGKSSIARALLPHLPIPAIHSGIDHFLERTPPGFITVLPADSPARDLGWRQRHRPDGKIPSKFLLVVTLRIMRLFRGGWGPRNGR